jgi:HK97 gp10 family phage protein
MAVRIVISSEAVPGLEAALIEKLEPVARRVVSNAKRLVPVDTYNLHDNIESQVGPEGGKIVARVGTDVEYGLYVEQGTSRARAQPWLRPAAMQAGAL